MAVDPCALIEDWSFEITAKDADRVGACADVIPAGTKILIAFLASEPLEARVAAARRIRELGFVPVPHISARRLRSRAELERFLDGLRRQASIDRILVVAGDPPEAMGPYPDALAVIRSGLLKDYGVQGVGVAGYPQGHPAIGEDQLWRAKREKRDALRAQNLDFVLATQFGFDAAQILDWLERVRRNGVDGRIRIGVPGPTNAGRLLAFASRCGVDASASVMKKYGVGLGKLLMTSTPDQLLDALAGGLDPAAHGEVLLHFFPFGGVKATAEWVRDFRAKKRCAPLASAALNPRTAPLESQAR